MNLFCKAIEAAACQVVVNGPAFMWLVESVEDSVDHRTQSDAGDLDDSLREFELFEVRIDFVAADVLAKLFAAVEQFHTGEVAAPFVVEWAVIAAAVRDPELRAVKGYGVWRH